MTSAGFASDPSPVCIYCDEPGAVETQAHIYQCSCWRFRISKHLDLLVPPEERATWPAVTLHCGVFMLRNEWLAREQAFGQEPAPPYYPVPLQIEDAALETRQHGRFVAATDGACSDASVPLLRRAGSAVILAKSILRT